MKRIISFLLLSTAGAAQSPGAFTPIGNLTTPRASHSATLLTNGKGLIAGGATSGQRRTLRSFTGSPAMGSMHVGRTVATTPEMWIH